MIKSNDQNIQNSGQLASNSKHEVNHPNQLMYHEITKYVNQKMCSPQGV